MTSQSPNLRRDVKTPARRLFAVVSFALNFHFSPSAKVSFRFEEKIETGMFTFFLLWKMRTKQHFVGK